MPRYVIERSIPNAGRMTREQLQGIAQASNGVIHDMQRDGTHLQWNHSYVSDDTLHCVYVAPNEEAVREHARCGGFPADHIFEVRTMIGPTTAE